MVEVSVLFVVLNSPISELKSVNCTSLYLINLGSRCTILTERVLKCSSFETKINEMIAKTPFIVKRILYTFGMSAIAIIDSRKFLNWFTINTFKNKWVAFTLEDIHENLDGDELHTVRKFLDIMDKKCYFELPSKII